MSHPDQVEQFRAGQRPSASSLQHVANLARRSGASPAAYADGFGMYERPRPVKGEAPLQYRMVYDDAPPYAMIRMGGFSQALQITYGHKPDQYAAVPYIIDAGSGCKEDETGTAVMATERPAKVLLDYDTSFRDDMHFFGQEVGPINGRWGISHNGHGFHYVGYAEENDGTEENPDYIYVIRGRAVPPLVRQWYSSGPTVFDNSATATAGYVQSSATLGSMTFRTRHTKLWPHSDFVEMLTPSAYGDPLLQVKQAGWWRFWWGVRLYGIGGSPVVNNWNIPELITDTTTAADGHTHDYQRWDGVLNGAYFTARLGNSSQYIESRDSIWLNGDHATNVALQGMLFDQLDANETLALTMTLMPTGVLASNAEVRVGEAYILAEYISGVVPVSGGLWT